MKFFIFTCLLAVALAKHKIKHSSSSGGSVNISQEKFNQEKKEWVIHPIKERARNMKEMEHFISSSSEESGEVLVENKINPFYQKKNFLQYLQALHQPRIVRNPRDQIKSSAYPLFSAVIQSREQLSTSEEPASISQEKIPKNIDLNKMAQYHQRFPLPQHFKTVQYQTAIKPWNHIKNNAYQIIPIVNTGYLLSWTLSHLVYHFVLCIRPAMGQSLTGKSTFCSFLPVILRIISMFGQAYE